MNRGNIRDLMDMDYIDQLSPKEKEFLSKFVTEFYSASFDHKKTQYKNKQPLHKGKKARRKPLIKLLGQKKKNTGMILLTKKEHKKQP